MARSGCFIPVMLIIVLLNGGCDGDAAPAGNGRGAGAAAPLPSPAEVMGDGVIRGQVRFAGEPPEMRLIENRTCHRDAEPIYDESVVVNENGTLRNVFVYLKEAPAADGSQAEPELLDQVDCRYTPRIVAIQVNQPLRIRTSDPTLHNVHWRTRVNPSANFGMTTAGSERTVSFRGEEMIRVRCDVHPWMTAYIGVFEHPFFDTTQDQGMFEIIGVPEGEYTLVAWHETYGTREQTVSIAAGQALEIDFIYQAP